MKSKLIDAVAMEFLESEAKRGLLAEKVGRHSQTIWNQLKCGSSRLCQPHYLEAIREVLGLPADAVIVEIIRETRQGVEL